MSALPGVSNVIFQALKGIIEQEKYPSQLGSVRVKRQPYYHCQAIGASLASSYTAFNVARAKGVTNIPQQGNFPNDQAYIIRSASVYITAGVSAAGAADAEGAQIGFHATAPTQDDLANWLIQVHQAGIFSLRVGDFQLIEATRDLCHFPAGGGIDLQAALSSNSATTGAYQALYVQNGSPVCDNLFHMIPYPAYAGSPVEATVEFPTAINPPSNVDAVLNVVIDGELITTGR